MTTDKTEKCGCKVIRDDSIHTEYGIGIKIEHCPLHANAAETKRRLDLALYHEEQTHRVLGAILGTKDTLENGAKKLKAERDEAVEIMTKVLDMVNRAKGKTTTGLCVMLGAMADFLSRIDGQKEGG